MVRRTETKVGKDAELIVAPAFIHSFTSFDIRGMEESKRKQEEDGKSKDKMHKQMTNEVCVRESKQE